ncbi:hypothetical protein [Lentzea sp. NPDC051838]|uniref:hypothetical protein n=1 Tax=Lentzea sp. NPDC051838 TaxID=3154849 RepID=UPI00341EC499
MSEEVVTSGKVGALSGGSWTDIFGGGLSAVVEASKAVAVAVETQQLSVDPHLVDTMIKKLTEMQDELGKIQRKREVLSNKMKLGGGYAENIANANLQFGTAAITQIADVARAIDSLKTQIEKSRASYRNVDQAGADSLNKINGKS